MKMHTRRPHAEYEALNLRKLTEGLTYAGPSDGSVVPIATLQYWGRRFEAEQAPQETASDNDRSTFVRVVVESRCCVGLHLDVALLVVRVTGMLDQAITVETVLVKSDTIPNRLALTVREILVDAS